MGFFKKKIPMVPSVVYKSLNIFSLWFIHDGYHREKNIFSKCPGYHILLNNIPSKYNLKTNGQGGLYLN